MQEKPDTSLPSSLPAPLQRVALSLRNFGWISGAIQAALAVISALVLLFSSFSRSVGEEGSNPGAGFGLFFAICGLASLGVGTFFAFRYRNTGRKLLSANASTRPSKADTLRVIRVGLIVNLVGMLLTILGSQAIIGSILARSVSQPAGLTVYDASRFVRPLDLFLVQANINIIAGHFVGIAIAIWLYNRVNR